MSSFRSSVSRLGSVSAIRRACNCQRLKDFRRLRG
jgi:hypothetical protein